MDTLLPILQALREASVSFVVVGGVAVVLRGHPRLTVDLDVALDLRDRDNVRRAVSALTDVGLRPRLPVAASDFAEDPLPYAGLEDRAGLVAVGGLEVPVASPQDLIEMKKAAGRTQDLADIEALEALEALMSQRTEQWDGGWDADRRTKRAAWAAMSAAERLASLEEALDLAHRTGVLAQDRRRQQAADRMAEQLG